LLTDGSAVLVSIEGHQEYRATVATGRPNRTQVSVFGGFLVNTAFELDD
jgi:hypothetical protein